MRGCFRNVLRHIVVEPEFAFAGEPQNNRCQNIFGDRSDVKDRVGCDWNSVLDIG